MNFMGDIIFSFKPQNIKEILSIELERNYAYITYGPLLLQPKQVQYQLLMIMTHYWIYIVGG